jgi:predicted amidohydrolase YtcJ
MNRWLWPAFLAASLEAAPPHEAERADSIWINGAIYTLDEKFTRVEALAVRGGRVLLAGSTAEVRKLADGSTKVHDLAGQCLTPGLIDCHGHLASLGSFAAGWLDLHDTRSFHEVVVRVKEAAARAGPGEWVLGGRWDQSLWGESEPPTNEELSRACPELPVWLERVDGHAGLANRNAMALAGIGPQTVSPPGGEILRDARGHLTGLFVDNAMALIDRHLPGGRKSAADLILLAQERCLAAGLTGVHDAGIGLEEAEAYRKLEAEGKLRLRVYGMLRGALGADWFRRHRPAAGERFSLRGIKLMADGAMGSRGAWLLEPYSDRPRDSQGRPYTGLPVMEPRFIREVAEAALENGWQVSTHAIGDRAIRETLDGYQAALRKRATADHRFRIEHAQNPAPSDIPRFAELGVIASMQPSHATSDMRWAEARVGSERVKTAYAWRSFLRAGSRLAFGSDFPVESENPLLGIYAALTRTDAEGKPPGGWMAEEVLTREEALRSFTTAAAFAGFEEATRGSLEPGKLADFVVWSKDIVACPPRELLVAAPLQVVIGGQAAREMTTGPPEWAEAMRRVHARFKGKSGTFVQFGDSITVTLAFWSPLEEPPRSAPAEMAAARERVKARLQPECWRGWKGPRFGSDGGQTVRWARENVSSWLRELNPEAALVMFGTNDLTSVGLEEYRAKLREVVERCLENGTVVILSTIPPRSGLAPKAEAYSRAAREVARELKVPLTDFHAEVLKRRPTDWDGSADAFRGFEGYEVPTLISRDGVHPSNPRKYQGDYSEEALRSSGYSLRNYLTLLKYDEVIWTLSAAPSKPPPSGGETGRSPPPHLRGRPPAEPWFPKAPPLPPPAGEVARVSSVEELFQAAEGARPGRTILLSDGHYDLPRRLDLRAGGLTLRGGSGDREKVVLDGARAGLGELVAISGASGVTIADLTIENGRWNGFKIDSDKNVQRLTIHNCIVHNVWQRGIKGVIVPVRERERIRPTGCRVEYCLLYNDRKKEFADDPTDRPDTFNGDYIGGLDVMYARDWTVSDNVFLGIQGRTRQGRGAIFFWHESEGCTIERNVIVDCDSGICLGNAFRGEETKIHARRFLVRNNFVTRAPEGGIVAVYTRDSKVLHNTIHDPGSKLGRLIRVVNENDGLLVANNLLSGPEPRIESSSAIQLTHNLSRDLTGFLVDPARGNLRLSSMPEGVAGRALKLPEVREDIDRAPRGESPDLGAQELSARAPR